MLRWAILIWILGLVTIVPYGTYYLFFEARREQYALLITIVLFWVFGYWGVAGPLVTAIKVRRIFKTLESAAAQGQLAAQLREAEAQDVAVRMIASENGIPRFVAARLYRALVRRLAEGQGER